jgi:hypothetical protein
MAQLVPIHFAFWSSLTIAMNLPTKTSFSTKPFQATGEDSQTLTVTDDLSTALTLSLVSRKLDVRIVRDDEALSGESPRVFARPRFAQEVA